MRVRRPDTTEGTTQSQSAAEYVVELELSHLCDPGVDHDRVPTRNVFDETASELCSEAERRNDEGFKQPIADAV